MAGEDDVDCDADADDDYDCDADDDYVDDGDWDDDDGNRLRNRTIVMMMLNEEVMTHGVLMWFKVLS